MTSWQGFLGLALVIGYLLLGLWLEHVREKPVYERPRLLSRPRFLMGYSILRAALFLLGWGLLLRVSLPCALVLASILAGAWMWKRTVQGRPHRHRMIRRAFEREKARDPAASDVQVLSRILHALHPRWGEELIEQIAADNPTPEGVADMVIRIERGALPSGFDPARMLRR
jgi:hypothetical protein